MKKSFPQAVLDGNHAIEDPKFPGSRLPLWCIKFWEEMLDVVDAQSQWKKSMVWLDEHIRRTLPGSEPIAHMQLACTRLLELRWNECKG
jgi:hypothetical protein